ncbi:wd40 repeat-like protein [Lichtheimia corymbifera JMRC:FSU:9682]|uniref:Wd40 repeat-like protein n=1 Tax=Lichtheimia corymbifera JMRC:FSU:9682 TaxID=1263082 RepID=A0A068RUR9_9FUNG|nr:wd40 repeat-like protein [Lichtheimia corymbifera JMRC:FSU:9682]
MPPQEPISSHSQHRSVKSRIARYLRRTTLSSFAVLASQITTASNSQVPDICSSTTFEVASSSSSSSSDDDNKQQEQQCLCRQESDTTHSLRARSNTICGSYAMLPIDEGFHQSQQKLFSSTVSQEEEEKSGDAYKYDILDRLPVELSQCILRHCDFETILVLSLVSRRWHFLCLDRILWRNLYIHHPRWPSAQKYRRKREQHEDDTTIDYRQLYRERFLLDRRWSSGDKRMSVIEGHADSIYCVQFDSSKIVTGSRDRSIKCWDHQGRCLRTMTGHYASVLCLQYDDDIMVSGSSDHTILVWDMRTFQVIRRLRGHASGVLDVCFDDKIIASCSKDATVRLWSREDGRLIRILHGHRGPVNAIQFRNNRLVSASGDAIIKLWDMQTGQCLRDFAGHTRGLACIRFDGHRIVSGSNDNKIKVWNAETGECILTCSGHTGLVRALHFDQDKIVSGSYDQSIRVWDIRTGAQLHHFEACHSSWVFDVMFDETKIISQDQKIVIMDFAHGMDTQHII